jgi:hypothetical protein
LEPVRQSGSGPVGPDKTRRKVHPAGQNRIFAGFLPDICQCHVKNEPDGFYRTFFDFFVGFFAGLTSKMIRPDFDRTGQILKLAGPDRMQKIRPVPTLVYRRLDGYRCSSLFSPSALASIPTSV